MRRRVCRTRLAGARADSQSPRSVLAELGRTSEHFSHVLSEAADKQAGNTDADLKRLKYAVTNLKGGFMELYAHGRFLQGARVRLE